MTNLTTPDEDIEKLAKRLEHLAGGAGRSFQDASGVYTLTSLGLAARDALTSLQAQRDALREALEPFASAANTIVMKGSAEITPDDEAIYPGGAIRWKHLRRARSALSTKAGKEV